MKERRWHRLPESRGCIRDKGDRSIVFGNKKASDNLKAQEVEQTIARFEEGLNCAQAVFSTYGPHFGLDSEIAVRIAGALGSGMGMGETCGAVTGALMVIGLKQARLNGSSLFSKDRTEEIAREFVERFKARNVTTECRELLGCDISTREGLRSAQREKHFKKRCPKFVRDAAEILEEILEEEQDK
jgi:C_GCAxxG_C_C family probable redox protein